MPNWKDVLTDISQRRAKATREGQLAVDSIRQEFLEKLHKKTGRNVIAYYSGYLSKPDLAQLEINDEDKNGFMMTVHKLDRSKGLDLILHTPGGSIAATESIVDYLHKMFARDVRAIVPQIAMSAGTMIACSSKSILMSEHSNLGPIDPHLRGIPAVGVIDEFKKAYKEVKADPVKLKIWEPIIRQYTPTFLGQCENAINWSQQFVEDHLKSVMFAGEVDASSKAKFITRSLLNYKKNKAHNRHISMQECKAIKLKVDRIEDDPELQDLILTVHHCYMHSLMNTPAFKIIENQLGVAFVKQQAVG